MSTQNLLQAVRAHCRTLVATFAFACYSASAITFTNNTYIGATNTAFDGNDIVISNCAVTIDGNHIFASLHVAPGGLLTHSFIPNGAPVSTNILIVTNESQVLSATNPVTLVNSNVITATVTVTDPTGTNFYTNGADYTLTASNPWTLLARTTNSAIPDGSNVLVNYQAYGTPVSPGLLLTISSNVTVDTGGAINADGIGYGGSTGPGSGHSANGSFWDGSGGGYGGVGGTSSSNALGGATYGSFYVPGNLGSGGGSSYAGAGAPGGGLINISAGGNLIINGSVSANGASGTNSRSGGGSGGSIWMSGAVLAGNGTFTAKGGAGEPTHGGGGGGGRIAVTCSANSFTGAMAAYGGNGSTVGGAGTIYTRATGQNGLLLIDNNGQAGTNTALSVNDSTVGVVIQGKANVQPTAAWVVASLTIVSNSFLTAPQLVTINITSAGAITVKAGGGIIADSMGYGPGSGSGTGNGGPGPTYACSGAGYGGYGATGYPPTAAGGATYGLGAGVVTAGSGGGSETPQSTGGSGGGAIQITSQSGTLQVDGVISANGGNGMGIGGGGGSGGSINLSGGTLLGSGVISANGGSGANSVGGGGGGGSIYLANSTSLFGGTVSAYGGGGANWGGAGNVVIKTGSQYQLIIDNNGHLGTNTPLTLTAQSGAALTVRNGGIATSPNAGTQNIYGLNLYSNGWIVATPTTGMYLYIGGNATIQPGSGIVADAAGYSPGIGVGSGRTGTYCSGGGHGGLGGASYLNGVAGGLTYDTPAKPGGLGSGGGSTSPQSSGFGGGLIWLTITGSLEVDGIITANGGNGTGVGGGGGSGGSIWISTGTIAGEGTIAANGGSGAGSLGGGGGGGIISVSCSYNSFSGPITAYGGGGANWGGPGSVSTLVTGKNTQYILDSAGHPGPPTPLYSFSSSTADLLLRNGAMGLINGSVTLGNVSVNSNSWIVVSNTSSSSITFATATILPGGGIIADGNGFGPGIGTGAGRWGTVSGNNYLCSGAGHGGNGGNALTNAATGGPAYDNPLSPSQAGSGGGTIQGASIGGSGGAAINLHVTGLLQNDGIISANGSNGSGFGGGGGAGGSLYLQPGTLAGAGVIAANGGKGVDSTGGGGAGGCIAIIAQSYQFAGTVSAYGGSGANWGGAGTIYMNSQYIIDNNGQSGAATPINASSSSLSVIVRNGGVAYQYSQPETFGSLLIASNSYLEANPIAGNNAPGIVNLTVNGNATIQLGGGIITDGQGSSNGIGLGAGHVYTSSPFACSGGGGGRIAIVNFASDSFAGQISAYGGGGSGYGGAGTIYTQGSSLIVGNPQTYPKITVDNGGFAGAGTPLGAGIGLPTAPYNLAVQNGGDVPATSVSFPNLNNLTIGSGGLLTPTSTQATFDLLVPGNLTVAAGGAIAVDGEGYALGSGTGDGSNGSGAGYGGAGGYSLTAPGGSTYGSASMPTNFGSGGGSGTGPNVGGSAGGGALRLNVAGVLSVNGEITAEGQPGFQDNSGGGSGGSVWITAGTLIGSGLFAADGGPGELDYGSGGGGGRIAVYALANAFSGATSVAGGPGYSSGASGTVVNSNGVPALQVVSSSPTATINSAASSVVLNFNEAPNSVPATAVTITTPTGPIPSGSLAVSQISSGSYQVSFPQQTSVGTYTIAVSTNVTDLYNRPGLPYASSFVVSLPVIQGTVTDTNGQPIAGVLMQPAGGFSPATTDTNGNYTVGFISGSTFTVTPSLGTLVFVPMSISYTNATNSFTAQNYIGVPTLAATLASSADPTNFYLGWRAIPGVTYQVLTSTDLVNWTAFGPPIPPTNGPIQIPVPLGLKPQQYFQVTSGE